MDEHGKAQVSTLRQKRGPKLNKLETAWQDELRRTYPDATIRAQSVTLVLANGVRYTPDFFDLTNRRAWETKGFMRDDAAVKIKMAATLYPEITFTLVTKVRGGGWNHQEMLP